MPGTTYRIPKTGLYLEADGRVVKTPAADATVVDATEAMAPALRAAYVGKGLQMLGSKPDIVPGGPNLHEDLKHLAEGLEVIVLVGEVAELALKLAEFMGAFGHQQDALTVVLQHFDARLDRIEDANLAHWSQSRKDQIAFIHAHSAISLQAAQEYLELGRPQTIQWQTRMAAADRDSALAVATYTSSGLDGGYWLRPFSLKALGVEPSSPVSWLHFHPARNAILQTSYLQPVWDYRFALPAMIAALVARVGVLKAVKPTSLAQGQAGCDEIRKYAAFLRSVVQRIQDGLWNLDALAGDEGSRVQFLWRGRAPVAAAQIHSGYNYARVVYAYEWESLRPADPELWPAGLVEPYLSIDQVNANISNVGRHWWHLVWRDIGMIEMCKILSDLELACSLPYASRSIGQAQTTLLRAKLDVTSRWSAATATSLSHLTSRGDDADDSTRTYRIYTALERRDDAVRAVLRRTADELVALAPPDREARALHERERRGDAALRVAGADPAPSRRA